jgi:hypothetical protein
VLTLHLGYLRYEVAQHFLRIINLRGPIHASLQYGLVMKKMSMS